MILRLDPTIRKAVLAHARRDHPAEACGLLMGQVHESVLHVNQALPAANISPDSTRGSFQIDWLSLLAALRPNNGRRAGTATDRLIGVYHSHPESDTRPSERDRREAWDNLAYLIIGRPRGRMPEFRAWWRPIGDDHFIACRIKESAQWPGPHPGN